MKRREAQARRQHRAVSEDQIVNEWLAKQRRHHPLSTTTVGNAP